MNRSRRCSQTLALLAFAFVLWPAAPSAAADPASSPLDERISINLVDAKPGEALRSFSQLTGWRFDVRPGLDKPFTATLHNVRVRTALDVLCESVGCEWYQVDGTPPSIRVLPLPSSAEVEAAAPVPVEQALAEPISIELKGAAAKDVLSSFQVMLGADLEVAPGIAGEITLRLQAVPMRAALDAVCAQLGCAWVVDTSGPKPILRVRGKP